jgi:ribosome-binding protein aMBF1 (putative translation factor)
MMQPKGIAMILCDLCGQAKECSQKEIDGKEFDICFDCWNPLAEKLKGKGRVKRKRETVFLPPLEKEPEPQEPKPLPGEPPKILCRADRLQQAT